MRGAGANLARNVGRYRRNSEAACWRAVRAAAHCDVGRIRNTCDIASSSASFSAATIRKRSPSFRGEVSRCASTNTLIKTSSALGSGNSQGSAWCSLISRLHRHSPHLDPNKDGQLGFSRELSTALSFDLSDSRQCARFVA
jgi:hypothetical protein